MTNKLITKAVQALAPDLDFRVEDGNIDTIESLNGKEIPSKELIEAQIKIVEMEIASEAALRESSKASAFAKLAALGLTKDEVNGLIS